MEFKSANCVYVATELNRFISGAFLFNGMYLSLSKQTCRAGKYL